MGYGEFKKYGTHNIHELYEWNIDHVDNETGYYGRSKKREIYNH